MRLIRCNIQNFGKLHNFTYDFSEGCNTFCCENGWGKSTLAAFIRVMLYGFDNETKRDDYSNERKRYKSWQGGVYGGSLTFEAGGRQYIVTRIFGAKEKEDSFELRDAETNLESNDYSSKLGEEIFKIDSASFKRSIYIAQNFCETEVTGSISARLGKLAENTDDVTNYEKAAARLKAMLDSMNPNRKTGELAKLEEQIGTLTEELRGEYLIDEEISRLNQRIEYSRQFMAKDTQSASYDKSYELSREEQQELEYLDSMFEYISPTHAEIRENINASIRLAEVRQAVYKKQNYIDNEIKRKPQTKVNIALAVGIIILIAGFATAYLSAAELYHNLPDKIICIEAGAAGMLMSVIAFAVKIIANRKINQIKQKELEKLNRMAEVAEDLETDIREFIFRYYHDDEVEADDFISYLNVLAQNLKSYEKLSDKKSRQADAAKEYDKVAKYIENMSLLEDYNRRMAELRTKKDELADKKALLAELNEKYSQAKKKYMHLEYAKMYLEQSKQSFSAKYMQPLKVGFDKYFKLITGTAADRYNIDANINLTVNEQGMQRDTIYLSEGYRDLTAVCMRMALIEAMFKADDCREKPVIIFDDPFVNLDSHKTELAKKMLEEIAKEYQIIYFTCHESRNMLNIF